MLHLISQEPYIIWSSFVVHICKRIISTGVFYIFFRSLIFWVNSVVKEQNVCHTPYLSKHTSFDVFCCTNLKWWHLRGLLSFFQNFGFLGCWGGKGVKGKKWPKMTKNFCLTPYLRNCTSYDMIMVFGTHVYNDDISSNFFFHFFKILIFRFFQSSSINAKRKF